MGWDLVGFVVRLWRAKCFGTQVLSIRLQDTDIPGAQDAPDKQAAGFSVKSLGEVGAEGQVCQDFDGDCR